MRSASLILLSLALLLACDLDPTGLVRDASAPLQTDRLHYVIQRQVWELPDGPVARFQASIGYRYRNPTERTVYLVQCRSVSFRLQKRADMGDWTDVWAGPDYERCLGPPTVIPPDERISGTLELTGFEPNRQAWPQFSTADLVGLYRLTLISAVYLDDPASYPDGTLVEPDQLYSNQFELSVR